MISSITLHTSTLLPGLTAVISYLPNTIVSFDGYFFDDDGAHQSSSSDEYDGITATPWMFDGRRGNYDHIDNAWVSGEAMGEVEVFLRTPSLRTYT